MKATGKGAVLAVKHALEGSGSAQVKGWVRSVRKHKKFSFVQVTDGSSWENLQAVVQTKDLPADITSGSSVVVEGELVSQAKQGGVEMACESISMVGRCDGVAYPMQKKYHSPEFLREILHLRPRSYRFGAVMRIRSRAALAIHNFFDQNEFINVHTPILTSIDCEGAGEMFTLKDPFVEGAERYLSVSGQLHAEIFASSLSKVYTFGPTFRAENSNTSRHLCEFYMVEPEVAFHDIHQSMDLAEACVKHSLKECFRTHDTDIQKLCGEPEQQEDSGETLDTSKIKLEDVVRARDAAFARMSYDEAVEILLKSGQEFVHPVEWGLSLQSEHEKYLAEVYCERHPVFVTDYPKGCKAFYMKQNPDKPETVACFDLLVPRIGELIGGSAREDDYETLKSRIHALGGEEQLEKLHWYLDLRQYGTVPHAGWGLGFERLVQFITGTDNIRDVIPIPRSPGSFPL